MKRLPVLALCFFVLLLSISAQKPLTAEQLLEHGKQQFDQGEIDDAIADYTKAIEVKSDFAQAFLFRGIAYGINREREKAVDDYTAAITLDPQTFEAYFLRADIKTSFKDYDGAIGDMNSLLAVAPQNQDAYLERSYYFFRQNKKPEAAADLEKAAAINPNAPAGRFAKQVLQVIRGEKSGQMTLADCDRMLAKFPSLAPDIYFTRGFLQDQSGNFDGAIADYTKSIELNPNNPMTYENRGSSYIDKQQYAMAIEDFGKAIALKPDLALAYLNRGLAYIALGNETVAQTDFDQALKIEPNYKKGLKAKIADIKQKSGISK